MSTTALSRLLMAIACVFVVAMAWVDGRARALEDNVAAFRVEHDARMRELREDTRALEGQAAHLKPNVIGAHDGTGWVNAPAAQSACRICMSDRDGAFTCARCDGGGP